MEMSQTSFGDIGGYNCSLTPSLCKLWPGLTFLLQEPEFPTCCIWTVLHLPIPELHGPTAVFSPPARGASNKPAEVCPNLPPTAAQSF